MTIETLFTALKPAKSTPMPSIVNAAGINPPLFSRLRAACARCDSEVGALFGPASADHPVNEVLSQPSKAVRQEQHNDHEQKADERLPGLGEALHLADPC